jgi:hypothetical protein
MAGMAGMAGMSIEDAARIKGVGQLGENKPAWAD